MRHWWLQIIPYSVLGVGMHVTGHGSWFWLGLAIAAITIVLGVAGGKIYEQTRSA